MDELKDLINAIESSGEFTARVLFDPAVDPDVTVDEVIQRLKEFETEKFPSMKEE